MEMLSGNVAEGNQHSGQMLQIDKDSYYSRLTK